VGLNSVADLAGRKPNSYSVTAVRTPALTVIPANAGIQRFSRSCLVAMDARVRGHDTQGGLERTNRPGKRGREEEDVGVVARATPGR
jgi:hypothetical protein